MTINARSVLVLATIKDKDDKISSPTDSTVEDVMRQLADRESRLFSDVSKKNHVRAFGIKSFRSQSINQGKGFEESFKKNQSENQKPLIKCFNCHAFRHTKDRCFFAHSDLATDYFHKRYPIKKDRDEGRDEMQRIVVE